jgi:hypothetical protein
LTFVLEPKDKPFRGWSLLQLRGDRRRGIRVPCHLYGPGLCAGTCRQSVTVAERKQGGRFSLHLLSEHALLTGKNFPANYLRKNRKVQFSDELRIGCSNGATMKKRGKVVVLAGTIVLASTALLFAGKTATPPADETLWPTKGWEIASPASVGLDEQGLLSLDIEMVSGKYPALWDSFAVFLQSVPLSSTTRSQSGQSYQVPGVGGTCVPCYAPWNKVEQYCSGPLNLSRAGILT